MEKTKKATPAAPGKKKVIRRLVKNAKTGEVIKTEIVRIDSSGEMTVTSYPAGTPVPSLSSLQSQSSSQTKKIVRKTSTEAKSISPKRKTSQDSVAPQPAEGNVMPPLPSPPKPKFLEKQEETNNAKPTLTDVGPSVPANVPGLEDLLKKEEELRRFSESERDRSEKPKTKEGEESLETALISIMKRKRQRDPKARRRGLAASTRPRRASDDEMEKGADDGFDDTDYRSISKKEENQEDEEAERKRRERHRRRKEKKHKERSQADRDDVEEYQGETGPLDLPEIESYRKREEETPMEGVENGGPQLPEGEETELAKKLEDATIKPEADGDTQPVEKEEEDSASDDDKKKKKKKHKHKKKKKKTKKQKKRESKSGSEKEDKEEKVKSKSKSKSRSRSRSLSSISLSSISSAFSDSFDFAGMNFDPGEGGFDMALVEYQQMREQVLGGPFAGRGFDPYFRGRGSFRGMPRFPGPFQGAGWRPPGPAFHFFQPDPNFGHFPGGPMGPDGEKGGDATRGRGRGVPANQGPWRGRGLRGRGIPPGFHRNYTEDDQGGAVYVQGNSSSGSDSGGRKKKKKKHRRRSYSSSSYSDSGSSRSRSRSRRRHRRRHRSSSYSSRSSRSYSSYSSRSRSYSRSSRSRSSYSRSSYSRSRSRSSKRSKSRTPVRGSPKTWGYDNDDIGRRASPSYHAYDEDGFKPPVRDTHSDDEEVPWWAEFDKTYEVEKKKLEEEKKKLEEEERKMKGEPAEEPQLPSIVSTDEIEIVRCVMNLVDKARSQQDEALETARECIDDIITKISVVPVQATQLHEEVEDPFEKVIHDCVDSILDRVCPNDPQTAARLCLKEIIDTVVEQEEEDKANAEATEMEKEITESEKSRLFQCYLKAQKLTEQIKTERKAKGLPEEKSQMEDEKQKNDDKRKDKRGHRSRHRRRSRSRSRDRGRRRRRRSSSDSRSRSSSRSSDARVPLVSEESLRQAQALLTMQQQQLQVAGLLGTGMPNLAGLTQAAALAAGITPALLAQTGLKSSDLPSLMGEKPKEKEEAKVQPKWDKDKVEAMSKKDDLTRKLMQRMKEKKMKQDDGSASPTFQGRKEKGAEATAEKVFSGGNLKSRKIAISSTFGKLWSKVEGSPRQDDDLQDIPKGYNKSEIVAATSEVKDQPNAEKLKAEEQEKKLAAWSDQQARLKEEAQREMREQIVRAERAKKEKMKEEILEQERQREIMRIREEVRSQIRKEIQEEIEKERKTVMEDPAVRGRLLELEALRSQSGLIANDGVKAVASSSNIPVAAASTPTLSVPAGSAMRDQRWYQQQMKNKQDMTKWMESHGYFMSEMDDNTLKRMQMTYMQNWTPTQRQGYMQWYWQQKQYMGPGYYPQHMMGQRQSQASQVRPNTDYQTRGPAFTRAPSQPQRSEHPGMPVRGPSSSMAQRIPYPGRGMPAQHGIPGQQQGRVIPSLMDQKPVLNHPYDQTDRQTYEYGHERYAGARDQYWHGEESKRQAGQNAALPPQHQQPPVSQQQPTNVAAQKPQEIPSLVSSGTVQMKQDQASVPSTQRQVSVNPPLHQYPPPGIEDEDSVSVLKPIPPQAIQQNTLGQGQPPPPGEVGDGAKAAGLPMVNDLGPPGEDAPVQIAATPMLQPGQVVMDDDSPAKSKKKKKQKKHRKHKKKKYSSSEEEEELDPEAEKAAILAKLQHLQDVEDGEIASDDGGQAAAGQEEKEARKKKKHKREKKKHKKRRDDSSDEEQQARAPQQIQTILPPPPAYMQPPGMPGHLPFDPARPNYPGRVPDQPDHQYPPPTGSGRYGIDPHNMYPPPDPGFIRHPRDHRGSGEPQHLRGLPEHRKPLMGPSGDHNPQRKRSPSPLPLVIPTDPQEYEIWQQKMHAKYNDGDAVKEGQGADGPSVMDQQLLKDINTLRRRQGVRDRHGGSNDDVIMMMRMIDDEQRRQRPSPLPRDHPPREGRKRGHGGMPRGRKRQRRPLPRKNYHDWDKPDDDGLIYARSGSDSSGWGSDTNMDFDRMLAKKRRETEKEQRDGHPPQGPGWDRRNIMPRNEDLLQGEKPQGIPVIGGGPRPIPTNVSTNRPTPPHHHPDMLPPTDYLPPDIMKLPPSYPGYHHDPHRDPRYPPPPVSSGGHPIQRLGAQPLPPPPIMPPMQPRMHPMDYRPRYGM